MKGSSRRDFVKGAAFLGATTVMASQVPLVFSSLAEDSRRRESGKATDYKYGYNDPANYITSTCLQCHIGCQIRVKSQDGVVVKIDGNPYSPQNRLPHLDYAASLEEASRGDGKLCPDGLSGIHTYYDPYRLVRLLKRAGPRGSNRWQTISFEKAIGEIVEGGDLFGEGNVDGLRQVFALRDTSIAKAMADDVAKLRKGQMSVAEFKANHATRLGLLIDPDHPDKGPKNNQFTAMIGRAQRGRSDYLKRFVFETFGSPNYIDHYNICEETRHLAFEHLTNQFEGGRWQGGKAHFKPDLLNSEFVIFWGTGAFEANFGKTAMAEKVTRSLRERNFKMAVVDPRLSKTAGKAQWWLPVRPGGDAALALGMIRWIFDQKRYDRTYLENANKAAANEDREPTWSSASYLVKVEGGRAARFLRASEAGVGSEEQLVVSRNGRLLAVTPGDDQTPLHGDLFATATVGTGQAKSSLLLLQERASEKTLQQWAELSGIEPRLIEEVANEFTSHGKKAAIDLYRGPTKHTNGYAATQAIFTLNFLIGNVDWKGGYTGGGGQWQEFGGKPGSPYDFSKLNPGKLTRFGMTQSREGWSYEETTLFREKGYPASRPFYPFSSGMYTEVLPSAADGYPYPMKALFLHMGTPALSIPGATQFTIDTLRDTKKIPLFVACDVVIGETSMYADYIIPDLTYLERWGIPQGIPDVQTQMSKVRQPAAVPLTEMVTVDGEEMPVSMESFLLAVAKKLDLPGVGREGFGPGMPFNRPEEFYLKAVANIAAGDQADQAVPDASNEEVATFVQARRSLPPGVFDANRWQAAIKPESWRKVVYVLNRGGRFESFDKAYEGQYAGHRFGKMVNFFVEPVALARNSLTGQPFDGLPAYQPATNGRGEVVDDKDYSYALITFKEVYWGQSRHANNYWTLAIQSENRVLMNKRDARALGLDDNDTVRLFSKSSSNGTVDLRDGTRVEIKGKIRAIEGIRPGVVAVSTHFGHWNAYGGSGKIVIDGKRVPADARRATGLTPNPLMRVDDAVGNVSLTEPIGGSASWFDSRVRVQKA